MVPTRSRVTVEAEATSPAWLSLGVSQADNDHTQPELFVLRERRYPREGVLLLREDRRVFPRPVCAHAADSGLGAVASMSVAFRGVAGYRVGF